MPLVVVNLLLTLFNDRQNVLVLCKTHLYLGFNLVKQQRPPSVAKTVDDFVNCVIYMRISAFDLKEKVLFAW
jgi:hypothetical protein